MPEFTPSRSDAIRKGLVTHAAHTLHRRVEVRSGDAPHATSTPRRPPRRLRVARWVTVAASVVIVAGVIAVGALSAVNRGRAPVVGDTAAPPATSGSPSAAPTPEITPTPTVDPSKPPPDPADPTTWIVSQEGMGPFTIGMSFRDALAVVPGMSDGCGYAYFLNPDRLILARGDLADDAPLLVVLWARAEGPRTAEGIGIGSPVDEVRAAYPDAEEVEQIGTYLRSGHIFVRIADGVVDEIGVTYGDIPWEYCG